MSEQWLVAAERYAQFSKTFGLRADQVRAWIELLEELKKFHRSSEGTAAMALLSISEQFIPLAKVEEKFHDLTKETFFGWRGLGPAKLVLTVLHGIPIPMSASVDEVALAIIKNGKTKEEAFAHLRSELDQIANKAPTPSV